MNNENIRNHFDAFERIEAFGVKYAGSFAVGGKARVQFDNNAAVVAAMEEAGVKKLSGTGDYNGGTDAKGLAALELRATMQAVVGTAEAIAEGEGMPEFDDRFRMPRSRSYEVLLTAGRVFHEEASLNPALFIEYEMPATFLADLQEDIDALDGADDIQKDGLGEQVGGHATLAGEVVKGMKARKQLKVLVKNKFRADAGVMAEWATASHIVRPRRDGNRPPAPPEG